MSFYDRAAATALRLFERFGKRIIVRKVTSGTYDTATGTAVPRNLDSTARGVILPLGPNETTVRGSLVQANDKRLLLDPTVSVDPDDHILDPGDLVGTKPREYSIVSISELKPADTRVLYDIHIRS